MKRSAALVAMFLALTTGAMAQTAVHQGRGTVNRIDAKASKVNLTHGPIPSLKWPEMTMDFAVKDRDALARLKSGQKVEFKMVEQSKGRYVITEIAPAK